MTAPRLRYKVSGPALTSTARQMFTCLVADKENPIPLFCCCFHKYPAFHGCLTASGKFCRAKLLRGCLNCPGPKGFVSKVLMRILRWVMDNKMPFLVLVKEDFLIWKERVGSRLFSNPFLTVENIILSSLLTLTKSHSDPGHASESPMQFARSSDLLWWTHLIETSLNPHPLNSPISFESVHLFPFPWLPSV